MATLQAYDVISPTWRTEAASILVDGAELSTEASGLGWPVGYVPTYVTLHSGDGWVFQMPCVKVDGANGDWWAATYRSSDGLKLTVFND